MKHKYLHELFSNEDMMFPYNEEDYPDFDERRTFNMDGSLIAYLYENLRFFQDEASKIVNFDFHKFEIDGEELTQRQCIDRMVEDCKIILLYDEVGDDMEFTGWKKTDAAKDDLFKVLSKVYWSMWW